MDNIKIKKANINELLKETDGSTIPYYQREYNWGNNEIERLFYDLLSNKTNEYYCGSIVLSKNIHGTKIVDGQQRISTFLIIIKYLKQYMKLNSIEDSFYNISNYEIVSENLKDKDILCDLIRADDNNELNDFIERNKNSIYIKNFLFISEYFKEKTVDEMKKFISIFNNTVCSLVVVNEEYDQFRLFTNINSTGLPLNAYDLAKNFIFSEINIKDKDIKIKLADLEKITDYLVIDINKKGKNLNEFIRYFIAYKTNYLDKSDATMLFRKFEEIYKEYYDRNINNLYDDFIKFGVYFKFIKTKLSTDKYNFYKQMRIIEYQFNTFVCLIIDILKNNSTYNKHSLEIVINKENEKEIEKSLLVIESYILFRSYTNQRSNDLTRYVPTINKDIIKYLNNYTYSSALFKVLYFDQKDNEKNIAMPSKEKFLGSLWTSNDIYNSKKKFTALLLMRIDEFINEKENKSNTSKYPKIEVEHILPQKFEKWLDENPSLNENELETYVNSLGNLTILSSKLNNEVKNNVFKIKKEKFLEKGTYIINNYLNKINEWNIKNIKERTKYLLGIINQIYNLDEFFDELGEEREEINLEFIITNINRTDKSQEFGKYLNTVKSFSKTQKIKITYNKICEAIYEFSVNNKSSKWVSINVFKEQEYSKCFLTWSLLKMLNIDTSKGSIHKNKSNQWVKEFIDKNKNLILDIVQECKN